MGQGQVVGMDVDDGCHEKGHRKACIHVGRREREYTVAVVTKQGG